MTMTTAYLVLATLTGLAVLAASTAVVTGVGHAVAAYGARHPIQIARLIDHFDAKDGRR
ncbi:hypothetical protein ACM0CO_19190 [Mycobacteroides abscessus subsp. abscessus]|uniref:hypothetical protein n=1 Tax=Mycobacteroides abscessus TaxID=36809 RepID=UPI0039F061FB